MPKTWTVKYRKRRSESGGNVVVSCLVVAICSQRARIRCEAAISLVLLVRDVVVHVCCSPIVLAC